MTDGAPEPASGGASTGTPERPATGDLVIDAALAELDGIPADDLDGSLAAGEALHRTLQSRLSDLGD